ncbi:hypothetical protein C7S16_2410 [Burkholderia thailandensis]|uniref:Uncharacterized protein n=1 Tax=Burkholderia thailandensis TaxID=57975 RepID=A0AAW9D3D4_BURTH|nr:hypothetical protein [Burkholderia thailandensis]MDW9255296.1 hypothetical protein [Burkholderia thailandensis]
MRGPRADASARGHRQAASVAGAMAARRYAMGCAAGARHARRST